MLEWVGLWHHPSKWHPRFLPLHSAGVWWKQSGKYSTRSLLRPVYGIWDAVVTLWVLSLCHWTEMSEAKKSKKKCRQYSLEYLKYGFYTSTDKIAAAACLKCEAVLSNEAVKPSRQAEHLKKAHPDKADRNLTFLLITLWQILKMANSYKRVSPLDLIELTSELTCIVSTISLHSWLLVSKVLEPKDFVTTSSIHPSNALFPSWGWGETATILVFRLSLW